VQEAISIRREPVARPLEQTLRNLIEGKMLEAGDRSAETKVPCRDDQEHTMSFAALDSEPNALYIDHQQLLRRLRQADP